MNKLNEQGKYYKQIEKALLYFDKNYASSPKLEDLAAHLHMSKFHFLRVFKEYVGVTPMQFLQATTLAHAKEKLKSSKSILDSSLDLGLSSSSRLHDLFVNFNAVTPNEYKKRGEALEISYGLGKSPFGNTMIALTSKGICALEFYEDSYDEVLKRLHKSWEKADFIRDDHKGQELLDKIFIKKDKVDLYVKGTNFQVNVWRAILNIKSGQLSSYSDVATLLEKPKAVRAVASAIGSNHIGFLIPCHRVISKTAAMSGYRWGIERKKIILSYEDQNNSLNKQGNVDE